MISRNQLNKISSLQLKKNRLASGCFIAEGDKTVREFLKSSLRIATIAATKDWLDLNRATIQQTDIEIIEVSEQELQKLSGLTTANELLAVAYIPSYEPDMSEIANSLSLVLDEIKDPGNLGTIIRIADWFGIAQR